MANQLSMTETRPLSDREREILEKLLRYGTAESGNFADRLPLVTVASRCGCGCPTIDLAVLGRSASPDSPTTILAGGEGLSPEGIRFEIILHGREGVISEMEVYSLTGEVPFTLPGVDSIGVHGAR